MKVGDMITNKTRYVNRPSGTRQRFLIAEIRDKTVNGISFKQLRAIRMPDGFRTRWSAIDGWEVISESR
tara:strand:- start:529 stop:735 length:207 start_codon:yes stop_codon:yes gene_type:complete